jgi:pimeloyl-ACP methyl ester carboxylesterase
MQAFSRLREIEAVAPALVALARRDARHDITSSDATANLDEGAGEVLLLIHGMGGSSDSWSGVIPLLAKKYRVVAPDLLGHGKSDEPRGDYSVGAFAVLLGAQWLRRACAWCTTFRRSQWWEHPRRSERTLIAVHAHSASIYAAD